MTDDECKTEFRFYRNDVYELSEIMNLPDRIVCYNGLNMDRTEAFYIFLKRSAYPYRYVGGSRWGLVLSVICPFLMLSVKTFKILMFSVIKKITVKC